MKTPPVILFAGDNGWKLARGESWMPVPGSVRADPLQIASAVSTLLNRSTPNITLALPASWCLSATIPLAGIPARNRRTALLYRLELLLPLTAEDIAADYILNEPDSALAICVSTASMKNMVDAIEENGTLITSIVPASVYATQAMIAQDLIDGVIWQSADSIEMLQISNGAIVGWYAFPAVEADLRWHCDAVFGRRSNPPSVTGCNLTPVMIKALQENPSVKLMEPINRSIEQGVISAVARNIASPIELRRDGLAPANALRAIRKPLAELAVAAVLLALCICAAAVWRATKLEGLATADRTVQEKLFNQTFPGRTVPANIVSRLRSEQRKLESGSSQPNDALPQTTLATLRSVLVALDGLPPAVRLAVNSLNVDDDKLTIDAELRNRADLAIVMDKLQQTPTLHIDPSQAEQIAGKGLHLTLTGSSVLESQAK